jgi:hypothetical protein
VSAVLPDHPKRLEIFLTVEEHRELKALAAMRGTSMKEEAAQAVRVRIGQAKAELREVLLR